MRCTLSTTSSASMSEGSIWATSPTQPIKVCMEPFETCGSMFLDFKSDFRFSTCVSSAFFFSSIIIVFAP